MTRSLRPARRTLLAGAASLLLPVGARAQAMRPLAAPMRCADFLATIGVNTHLGYSDGQYGDVAAVRQALDFVGVRHLRDGGPKPQTAARYAEAAAGGARFCMFWGQRQTMADALGQIGALEAAHPGAVDAIEGPNEIKPAYAYGGQTGNAGAQRFMLDLRAAMRSDPRLRRTPLVSFTSYERSAAECDFANHHPYPKAGKQPGELLRSVRDRYVGPNGLMPGKAMMLTEFGYHTLVGQPTRPGAWQGVTPELQAALILNGLFDNAAQGIARTYVYQLLDERPDGGAAPSQERHFGLFRFDGSPKPAAQALRTLGALLADRDPRARDFTPAPFAGRLQAPAPVSALALADASGRHYLALWNETPVWDDARFAPLEVAPTSVAVDLPAPQRVQAFDIVKGGGGDELGRTAHISMPIRAHPVVLRFG